MDWVQDMTARWMRILSAAGDGSTPLDEAVQQINEIGGIGGIGGAPGKKSRLAGLKRNAATPAEASTVTALSRQLIVGVLVSDLLVDQLCALTGQTREQFLAQLPGSMPHRLRDQQLRALRMELFGSCRLLQDAGRTSYQGLGSRIEELLRLAEEQASALIDAARAEAAEITASAAAQSPGPRSEEQ